MTRSPWRGANTVVSSSTTSNEKPSSAEYETGARSRQGKFAVGVGTLSQWSPEVYVVFADNGVRHLCDQLDGGWSCMKRSRDRVAFGTSWTSIHSATVRLFP
ncbi:hypothetical protein LZG04_27820 [Saccharothrix sp. S26]|uniref:hypothetical protein n=1 Tax=Saccharothrix sp. S26 TaxID=2907215 RepID=UPI001F40CC60|nr:hypothetical protein [Saccharothrix sp. S26]MCE6998578.1 hypothetical protein [Saccharothrix sp. S26]